MDICKYTFRVGVYKKGYIIFSNLNANTSHEFFFHVLEDISKWTLHELFIATGLGPNSFFFIVNCRALSTMF